MTRVRVVPGRPRARGVLVVDDVMTFGHTVADCARVLVAGDVEQVWTARFALTWWRHVDSALQQFVGII